MTDDTPHDPFPDETAETRDLLDQLQRAAGEGDSIETLHLTGHLLERGTLRSNDVVHLLRADALFEQEDFAAAAEQYRLAIAAGADDYSPAWFGLGNALAGVGNFEDAALALTRAAQLEPQQPAVWLQLGYALLEGRHFMQAELAFGNALQLTEGSKGHYGMAWHYYARAAGGNCTEGKLGDTTLGLQELRAAVAAGELGPALEQLGAVRALLADAAEPDFPFWHAWINPAFELDRGTDLLTPPASEAWAEAVSWPRDAAGAHRILRDVLIDLPEWGT